MSKRTLVYFSIVSGVIVLVGVGALLAWHYNWFGLHALTSEGSTNTATAACKKADKYDPIPEKTAADVQKQVDAYLSPSRSVKGNTKADGDNIDLTLSDYKTYPTSFITDAIFTDALNSYKDGDREGLKKWIQTKIDDITQKTEARYQAPLNTIGEKLINFFTVTINPIKGYKGEGSASAYKSGVCTFWCNENDILFRSIGEWEKKIPMDDGTTAQVNIGLSVEPDPVITASTAGLPNSFLSIGYNWSVTTVSGEYGFGKECKSSHNSYGVYIKHHTVGYMYVAVGYFDANGQPITGKGTDGVRAQSDKTIHFDRSGGQ
jgi:hypothetical protein